MPAEAAGERSLALKPGLFNPAPERLGPVEQQRGQTYRQALQSEIRQREFLQQRRAPTSPTLRLQGVGLRGGHERAIELQRARGELARMTRVLAR